MGFLAIVLLSSFGSVLARPDGEDLEPHPVFVAPRHSGEGAVAFTADDVQLMGWVTLGQFPGGNSSGSDCWGYTAPSGREYALMAMSHGTGFVEVTDPGSPVVIDFEPGPTSFWRALKTFSHYAYVVSEGGGGIQVFDLDAIDTGVVTLVNTVTVGGTTTATHTLALDEVSGFLYRAGGGGSGIRIYSLADPVNPTFVGESSFGYVHECQVVTWDLPGPHLGKEIAFCYTGGGVRILDVTNKSALTTIASFAYPGVAYSHQGWISADKQHFYMNDEQDDRIFGPSRTRIFDIADLAAPSYVGFFHGGGSSIDHNLYVKGNRIYEANYTSGLRIFDNSNPVAPVQIGFFDTDPTGDAQSFSSLWTNYPFFASGTILGGDVERGLFVWRAITPGLSFDFPSGQPGLIPPSGASIEFSVTEAVPSTLLAGSVALRYSTGGPFLSLAATPLGGELYRADLPDIHCGTTLAYYLAGKTIDGVTWTWPPAAETQVYHVLAANSESVASVDDMEVDLGWTVDLAADLAGFSTATTGTWTRVDPIGTSAQPEDDHTGAPGAFCWVTGQGTVGGALGDADVDLGATSLRSPIFDASSLTDPNIAYWRWYSNNGGAAPGADTMTVHLSNDGGATWTLIETIGPTGPDTYTGWIKSSVRISDFMTATDSMRLRFLASDLGDGSIVEAAVDDLILVDHGCPPAVRLLSLSPAEGPLAGGNWVTLSGSDFQPGTTVNFGGTPALQVNFIDPWTLKARVPSWTQPTGKKKRAVAPVDVTVAGPASDTLVNGYRYVLEVRGP